MSERLVPDWQKERGISTGSYRYDFICFELGHHTAERNQILQLSDVWPGYNKLAQKNQYKHTAVIYQQESIMRKVGDLFEFSSTDMGDYIIQVMMYAPSYSTLLVDLLHKEGQTQLRQEIPQFGPLTGARYSPFLREINGTVVLTGSKPGQLPDAVHC